LFFPLSPHPKIPSHLPQTPLGGWWESTIESPALLPWSPRRGGPGHRHPSPAGFFNLPPKDPVVFRRRPTCSPPPTKPNSTEATPNEPDPPAPPSGDPLFFPPAAILPFTHPPVCSRSSVPLSCSRLFPPSFCNPHPSVPPPGRPSVPPPPANPPPPPPPPPRAEGPPRPTLPFPDHSPLPALPSPLP